MDIPEIPASALLGVWRVASVEQQPTTTLANWSIYEVTLPSESQRTRHFVGCAVESRREGRTSSKVISFDPKTGKGVTSDSRVYVLHDQPGGNIDADYTWNWWCGINKAADIVDVTKEVWTAMREAAPKGRAEYSRVALTRDIPELGLTSGAEGLVVHIYDAPAFEVEFLTKKRKTICVATVNVADLRYVE